MRITRRFVKMTPEENRHTNAIRFQENGKTVYTQEPAVSNAAFDFSKKILIGKAHLDQDDELVNAPYDFTMHNKATLTDLQQMMQSVLFPSSVPKTRRFDLTEDDYRKLYQYMSEKPSESGYPQYDTTEFLTATPSSFSLKTAGKNTRIYPQL